MTASSDASRIDELIPTPHHGRAVVTFGFD